MEKLFAALVVLLVSPASLASAASGATIGLERNGEGAEIWDVYDLQTPGTPLIELRWVLSSLAGTTGAADYDLHLYRRGAFDDNRLVPSELLQKAATRAVEPRSEEMTVGLPAGTYPVAVVPFEAHGESYTLVASPGTLTLVGRTVVSR